MKDYLSVVLLSIAIFIIGLFLHQRKELNKYRELYDRVKQNVEAYQYANSELKGVVRQHQMTIDELRSSRDSIDMKLAEAIDAIKVKDSKIEYLQYQSTIMTKEDTVRFTDTIFNEKVNIDTLLYDEWYQLKLGLYYPSEIFVSPTFNSEKYVIISTKKEYNKKPSKFFFIRWFQKKHWVTEVDVVERNPYIDTKQQKYIKVVKY